MATHECQDGQLRYASAPVPRWRVLVDRAVDEVRRDGSLSLARRAARFVGRRVSTRLAGGAKKMPRERRLETTRLDLRKGDWVVVKTAEEIRRTLDGSAQTRGLGFMPGMFAQCGKRFRVYKRAETIVLEGTGETRRLKDTVLLEGSICDGEGFVCDRSCFYFWKEDWLHRA